MDVSLFMLKDDGRQKEFRIEPGKTIIGRREECDLRIPLAEVSRRHAQLIVVEAEGKPQVTIRDLGSANGTYVNNQRITEQELGAGDHLVVGPVVFTVQIDGEPAEVRAVQTRLEARKPVARAATAEGKESEAPEDEFGIGDDEEDPISALEALAASDDTAAIDLEDSFTTPENEDA